ncbi:MAG TPA: hypothetical protein VGI36_10840 [Candidatus Binataceae bacterium]
MRKTGKKPGKEQSAAGQVGFRFRGLARAAVWDSGSMILRWTAAGGLEAEGHFRNCQLSHPAQVGDRASRS